MMRSGKVVAIALVVLLGVVSAWAQAPSHIQAAQDFLLGWGKGNWDAVKSQAGGKVSVKVGGTEYALDPEAKKADVQLVLPFRGLSTVRTGGKVTGVTVEAMTIKVGSEEKKGKGTVTLEEKEGRVTVTGVAVE
jgi:hypothetical protein